jgi:hypothetical protein
MASKVVTIVINEPWILFSCKANSRTTCRGSVTGKTNAQGVFGMSGKVRVKGGNGVVVTFWAKTTGASGEITSPRVSIPIARWCSGVGAVQSPTRLTVLSKLLDGIERIYAPEESNIIPQCSAGPGGTRPDLLVLQVGCPWQGKPSGM